MIRLTGLGVEDFVLFLTLSLHFFLESFLCVLELPPDIVIGDVLIIVNVLVWSPHP